MWQEERTKTIDRLIAELDKTTTRVEAGGSRSRLGRVLLQIQKPDRRAESAPSDRHYSREDAASFQGRQVSASSSSDTSSLRRPRPQTVQEQDQPGLVAHERRRPVPARLVSLALAVVAQVFYLARHPQSRLTTSCTSCWECAIATSPSTAPGSTTDKLDIGECGWCWCIIERGAEIFIPRPYISYTGKHLSGHIGWMWDGAFGLRVILR